MGRRVARHLRALDGWGVALPSHQGGGVVSRHSWRGVARGVGGPGGVGGSRGVGGRVGGEVLWTTHWKP